MRKGIELPINTLIILAVVIIVLLFLVGIFLTGGTSAGDVFAMQAAKNKACQGVVTNCAGADTSAISVDYDVGGDKDTSNNNLLELCKKLGASDDTACKRLCGCTGSEAVGGVTGGGGVTTAKAPNGAACNSDAECQSGSCKPDLLGQKKCTASSPAAPPAPAGG